MTDYFALALVGWFAAAVLGAWLLSVLLAVWREKRP